VPVSKKRVKKDQRKSAPPAPKTLTPAKKKLSTQQILIYVISALVILSMAIVGLAGTGRSVSPTPTPSALTTPATSESAATATPQP
jgi:hypothetical protein